VKELLPLANNDTTASVRLRKLDETWHPKVLRSASVILASIYQLTRYRKGSRCHCSDAKLLEYLRRSDGLGIE
jgi:hypothetical protein